jgi:hypothetical protein
MTTRWWRALALFLLLVVLLGAVIATLIATADPHALSDAVIRIDGTEVALTGLHAHPLAAMVAGIVGALVAMVVVPLVVCVPLLAVVFGLACAVIAVAGTAALVLSPLLLLGWIMWRVARPAPAAR